MIDKWVKVGVGTKAQLHALVGARGGVSGLVGQESENTSACRRAVELLF